VDIAHVPLNRYLASKASRAASQEGSRMPLNVTVLSLGLTGLILFLIALAAHWRSYAASSGLAKAIALACPLEAAALGAFAAEHLAGASLVLPAVPRYMPWPFFWAYLVGCALLATALSLAFELTWPRLASISAMLSGIMLFLFVVMIHIPRLVATLDSRFSWNVALRDLTFAAGLIAFAAALGAWPPISRIIPRLFAAAVAIVFGVEHLLFPANLPGVPLEKLTPAWLFWPHVWAAVTGLTLILCGAAIFIPRYARTAAAILGLWQLLLILAIYLPMLALAAPGGAKFEALNYLWDTTLYAATFLLLSASTPQSQAHKLTLVSPQAAD
jgi:uncharacterized membrane protein